MKNLVKVAFVALCVSMMAVSCAPKTEETAATTDSTVTTTAAPAVEAAPADTTVKTETAK